MAAETPPTTPDSKAQPKIVHRLAIRTLLAVVVLGALFLGLRAWRDYSRDPNRFGQVSTAGDIAAIEYLDNGQQAVVIKSDGQILRSPGFETGNTERDLVWQPDGNRLYYVSDRKDSVFQVYRWRPVPGGESEDRTIGSRGKGSLTFPPDEAQPNELLLCSGGIVLELDPERKTTRQILPPVSNEIAVSSDEEGGGGTSQFAGVYGRLGESFAIAQYLPEGKGVAAVMRRDQGEVLIVQVFPKAGEKLQPPIPVIAGNKVYFALAPDGTLIYSVQDFQWPLNPPEEAIVDGKVTVPFRHGLGIYRPGVPPEPPIAVSPGPEYAFGPVSLSPDGSRLLVTVGKYADTGLTPDTLVIMPAKSEGGAAGAPLLRGEIYEPSWHPDGRHIAYVKRVDGKRQIYTARDDGAEEKLVTPEGSFGTPEFSPQLTKSE
jgi:hypothetical protein